MNDQGDYHLRGSILLPVAPSQTYHITTTRRLVVPPLFSSRPPHAPLLQKNHKILMSNDKDGTTLVIS
jgi:hypothetical protein